MHPNGYRPSDYVFLWHRAPLPAIAAIVPIVAHHEVMPIRDNPSRARTLPCDRRYVLSGVLDTIDSLCMQGAC